MNATPKDAISKSGPRKGADRSAATIVTRVTEAERREHRFRIAGDPAEAMKVVLAQLPDDET